MHRCQRIHIAITAPELHQGRFPSLEPISLGIQLIGLDCLSKLSTLIQMECRLATQVQINNQANKLNRLCGNLSIRRGFIYADTSTAK